MRFVLGLTLMCAIPTIVTATESHLMRWADVHGDWIVFTYEDDLWLVPAAGGDARRLTNHPGSERYARFSPDGSMLAFTAGYDGGSDVYVMDARGGVPRRLTFHPASDRVLGWHPDGQSVLFRSRREYPGRVEMLYTIPVDGGMPSKLPVDRGGLASFSPDGERIAYNRITREDHTWKRHQGGTAQDLWVGDLGTGEFSRLTDWKGTDNYPMWHGDAVYFTSDRDRGTLNLYRLDLDTREVEPLTTYADYDVKYPSLGPRHIVFQYAESLHLLDLASGNVAAVDVRLGSDRVPVRSGWVSVAGNTGAFGLSPDGDRVLLEARGEILSVPVEEGDVANLTRRSASREKDAAWSPDGRQVAFFSDRSGEEELWLLDPSEPLEWRQLTSGNTGFRMHPVWSPDSSKLLFTDKFMRLNLVDAATGDITVVDQGEYDDGWYRWGIQDYVFSPDSRFIAYTKLERSLYESIFLYTITSGTTTRLTGEETSDWSPSFDPEGRYLYFLSRRTFEPIMGFIDQNHVFLDTTLPYVMILSADAPSPFAEARPADDETASDGDAQVEVTIDLEGVERRIVAVEGIEPGDHHRLEATADGFVYLTRQRPQLLKYDMPGNGTTSGFDLEAYDLKKRKSTSLEQGVGNYHLSASGDTLVVRQSGHLQVLPVSQHAGGENGVDQRIELSDLSIKVDRGGEFLQVFNEAWRVQRDWFYDPGMHGVDWQGIGDKYRRFVPFCGNRADLNYLIGEMIGELNAGHTYISGGDIGSPGREVVTGLLGADLEQPEGSRYHRFAHIIDGNAWHPDERSPLQEPGCGISAGDYLIAIDGHEVAATDNVYKYLEDTVGRTVTISYSGTPDAHGASTCRVRPLASEAGLRYREWVERNRARVEQASGGTIGYLHLPNMMAPGLIEFARAFYPQYFKRGIIIDERYNGGGFVGDMIIDRLERRLWAITQPREGQAVPDPERGFHGHLAVLVNEDTGSNGEYFAEAIRRKGLATVIGVRTWGGAVGIEPHQDLVDGAVTTPPQFAPYGLDGEWLIEGHGVEPDVEVHNLPGDVVAGRDPQLDAAVRHLLDAIAAQPMLIPEHPPYPIRSKPGEGQPLARDTEPAG